MSVKQITTGQDSFLDIVANLVGVLIILVVVVGAQAKSSWEIAEPDPEPAIEVTELEQKLEQAQNRARKLKIDNHQLENNIVCEESINDRLADIRHQLLVETELFQQEIDTKKKQRRAELDAHQQARLDRMEEQKQLEIHLASLESEIESLPAVQPQTKIIRHRSNPIARTVFFDEIHFQIRDGKIVYVPLNELVSLMKSEWKVKSEKLLQANRTVETVGPVQNFRLQYVLRGQTVYSPDRLQKRQRVEFDHFTIFPVNESVGVTTAEALRAGSGLESVLSRYEPGKTTVSLWVYSDSYPNYNAVKDWLHDRGYQVACWPLDSDRWISGGPNGFRTSAQ